MKIAAILETEISYAGGFNQSLNAILQISRLVKGKFEFQILTSYASNLAPLREMGFEAVLFKRTFMDRLILFLASHNLARRHLKSLRRFSCFERTCANAKVDLVYFLSPSDLAYSLEKLNYIMTIWDMCHRDYPEFPEVREANEFHYRERLYKSCISASYLTLVDSPSLANGISRTYGVDGGRLLSMPFSPAFFLQAKDSLDKNTVLQKYGLTEGYYFYPAQMWPHKNHIRILQALQILKKKNTARPVVFAGGGERNLNYLKRRAIEYGVEDLVHFVGFVEARAMRALFEGCVAVVMPTYFGPTNLPPLEAWSLGKPVLYSKHLAEQAGVAAYLVDPDNADELAQAMEDILDTSRQQHYIQKGHERLKEIEAERSVAENNLVASLQTYEARRLTFE